MTAKEMSEIFSILMLAFPSAEMFKGGVERLMPTIKLWAKALPEVDFWTGKQAVMQLCRTCRYPPTIAEFREQAEKVTSELQRRLWVTWSDIRFSDNKPGGLAAYYEGLQAGNPARAAIDAMGGPDKLISWSKDVGGKTVSCWNYEEFKRQFFVAMKNLPELPAGDRKALTGGAR